MYSSSLQTSAGQMSKPRHEVILEEKLIALDMAGTVQRLRSFVIDCFLCEARPKTVEQLRRHLIDHYK